MLFFSSSVSYILPDPVDFQLLTKVSVILYDDCKGYLSFRDSRKGDKMEKLEKKLLKISMAASCTLSLLMPNVAMAQENDQATESVQAEIYPKPQKME